jgi:hypothetical protein
MARQASFRLHTWPTALFLVQGFDHGSAPGRLWNMWNTQRKMIKWWFLRWVPRFHTQQFCGLKQLQTWSNNIKYVANVAATSMWRVEHWATRINLEGWATKMCDFEQMENIKRGDLSHQTGGVTGARCRFPNEERVQEKNRWLTDFILAPGCWQCVCVWLSWLKRCYIIIIDREWHEAQYHLRNSQLFPSAACHAPSSPAELRCGLKKDSGTSGPNQKPWLQTLELQWLWKGFLGLFSIPSRHHSFF